MTKISTNLAVMEPMATYSTDLPKWVQVLVDCPGIQGLYTYAVPTEMVVQVGDILSVPFGSQMIGGIAIGFITDLPADLSPAQIKPIEEVITQSFFPASYWQLLDRVADYYRTELMSVIRMALPPGLLGRSQRRIRLKIEDLPSGAELFLSLPAREILQLLQNQPTHNYSYVHLQRQVRGCQRGIRELTKRGWIESYLEDPKNIRAKQQDVVILLTQNSDIKLTPRQQEVLEVLRRQGGELWVSDLSKLANCTNSVIKKLVDNGYVAIEKRERLRLLSTVEMARDQAKTLTIAQSKAVDTLKKLNGFHQVLLHGVTGSGKT